MSHPPLEIGAFVPDFTLPREDGTMITLSELQPSQVVVYFYPRDNTPGCTLEAQDFSQLADEFAKANTRIIGISKDSIASHEKFCRKHSLNLILASDADSDVCEIWGTWGEKKNYGKTYMGITRASFLIGADGRLVQAWPKVSVKGHAQEVLAAARALQAGV